MRLFAQEADQESNSVVDTLRAAVQHLVESDYSKEAFHILVLVLAAGADIHFKLADGWSFNNAQLKDPMLAEMMRVGVAASESRSLPQAPSRSRAVARSPSTPPRL